MRRASALLAITALLAAPAAVFAAEPFAAELTAEAEVPAPTVPDGYAGSGSATATISDDASSIDYEVTFEGLTGPPVASHIHWGAVGEAGPIILPLEHGDSPFSGTLTEADFTPAEGGPQTFAEALDAIRDGNTYVNIHTEANGPGEIRGQLMEIPDTATGDSETAVAGGQTALVLVLVAAAAFLLTFRRFAVKRA
jgi:hypothetical protein